MSEPLTLPRSLAAYGTPAFNETLAYELLDNLWKLPLEKLCKKGGWPYQDGPFSLYEIDVEDRGGALRIACGVSFEEVVPSCCSGGAITDNHMGNLMLTIDKTTALSEAAVTAI